MSDLLHHYEGWSGARTGYRTRMGFFVREGVKNALRSKWALAIVLITYGLIVLPRVFEAFVLPTVDQPAFFALFFNDLQLLLLLFAAVAGAGIIASDLKDGSIVLHITRRIGKSGYLGGRLLTLAIVLSVLTILPYVVILAVALLSTSGAGLADGARVVIAGFFVGIMFSVFFTLLVSALSAVLKDNRYAGAALFFIVLFSDIAASIMEGLSSNAYAPLLSVGNNLLAVTQWLFGLSSPFEISAGYSGAVIVVICALCAFLLARELLMGERA